MNFEELLGSAAAGTARVAVAAAHDEDVLGAVLEAKERGIASPVLVGDAGKIAAIVKERGVDAAKLEIIDEKDLVSAARKAVALVREGKADFLMKGMIPTADLLRAVLDKENGLRGGGLLSHVALLETPHIDKILLVSDAAMVMYPDLKQKVDLIKNAVAVAAALGIERPKVAVLAAVEVVNPDMPATLDAAALVQMNRRGQLKGCVIDGPLAMDNAVSLAAAEHKGVVSDVAGLADILIAPNIESGNILVKTAVYLGGGIMAGVIVGAKVPIVLTSRADPARAKLISIACAAKMSIK